MDNRSHIRAVEGEEQSDRGALPPPASTLDRGHEAQPDPYSAPLPYVDEADESVSAAPSRWLPVLFLALIAGWTALFVWSQRAEFGGAVDAQRVVGWIGTWAVPVLLVLTVWLLVTRSSTREAARFAGVARSLSDEAALLETRLVTVNRELSLAREFLTTQSRELNYFGRAAAEGLTRHAQALEALLRENGQQFDSIDKVSVTALANMEQLRDQLPVIANSSRDVSNQIGNAGRTAQDQLSALIQGFERLNEFGSASERQVLSLRQRVDEALAAFALHSEHLDISTDSRFAALKDEVEAFRSRVDDAEAAHLEAMRARSAAMLEQIDLAETQMRDRGEAALSLLRSRLADLQGDVSGIETLLAERENDARGAWMQHLADLRERHAALGDEIARRNAAFAADQTAAIGALSAELRAVDHALDERRERNRRELDALARDSEAVAERIAAAGGTFEIVSQQARDAHGSLGEAVARLSATLMESREALDGTDMAIAALTDASTRLLDLLQASAQQGRDALPAALAHSEERLAAIGAQTESVRAVLDQARQSGDALLHTVEAAETRTRAAMGDVDRMQSEFGETAAAQIDGIERLRASVAALGAENRAVAQTAQDVLVEAIATLEQATRGAFAALAEGQDRQVHAIAAQVGEKSAAAIERAVAEHMEGAVAALEDARQRSADAGIGAATQLRDQLAKVSELTVNLETRVARARSEAQERVDNDFSRRVALITESLNSGAIDVAKALSTDVSDTAWASYLRGDRGIFTRRAVRLIENSEAREIAAIYNDDPDFREHVNRYIHDFESMLRTLLSTRDGNALSVTMLSSDMGKLYVILAQALERLRQ